MGRPSTYKWNEFERGDTRSFRIKPTRSAVAMVMTLAREWAKRKGVGRTFKVFSLDKHSISVRRIK